MRPAPEASPAPFVDPHELHSFGAARYGASVIAYHCIVARYQSEVSRRFRVVDWIKSYKKQTTGRREDGEAQQRVRDDGSGVQGLGGARHREIAEMAAGYHGPAQHADAR